MDPFKDPRLSVPSATPSPSIDNALKASAGEPHAEDFARLLNRETAASDPMPKPPKDETMRQFLDDRDRLLQERAEKANMGGRPSGTPPAVGLPASGSVPHDLRRGSGPPTGGAIGFPLYPPDSAWRPAMAPLQNDPQSEPAPRRRKPDGDSEEAAARVDGDLIEELLAHGLKDPVTGLQDPRMRAEAPFNPQTGWTQMMGEATVSGRWVSTRDPGGTYQVCVVGDARRSIETRVADKMQHIEERLGQIHISRRIGPPPKFSPES